ncbi:unnamed protein product, partial [Protopolystoma xenopodis]
NQYCSSRLGRSCHPSCNIPSTNAPTAALRCGNVRTQQRRRGFCVWLDPFVYLRRASILSSPASSFAMSGGRLGVDGNSPGFQYQYQIQQSRQQQQPLPSVPSAATLRSLLGEIDSTGARIFSTRELLMNSDSEDDENGVGTEKTIISRTSSPSNDLAIVTHDDPSTFPALTAPASLTDEHLVSKASDAAIGLATCVSLNSDETPSIVPPSKLAPDHNLSPTPLTFIVGASSDCSKMHPEPIPLVSRPAKIREPSAVFNDYTSNEGKEELKKENIMCKSDRGIVQSSRGRRYSLPDFCPVAPFSILDKLKALHSWTVSSDAEVDDGEDECFLMSIPSGNMSSYAFDQVAMATPQLMLGPVTYLEDPEPPSCKSRSLLQF